MFLNAKDYEHFQIDYGYDENDLPTYIEVIVYEYSETGEYNISGGFKSEEYINAFITFTITDHERNVLQEEVDEIKSQSSASQWSMGAKIADEIDRRIQELYDDEETEYRLSMAGL